MKKQIKQITCPDCGGYGYIIEVRATFCGNVNEHGSCCGVPDAEQYKKECNCNRGIILIEE